MHGCSTLGDVLGRRGTSSATLEGSPLSSATSATPSGGTGGVLGRLTGSGWMSRLTAQQPQPAPMPVSGGGSTGSKAASPQQAGQRIQWSRRPAAPEERQPGPEPEVSKAIGKGASGSGNVSSLSQQSILSWLPGMTPAAKLVDTQGRGQVILAGRLALVLAVE